MNSIFVELIKVLYKILYLIKIIKYNSFKLNAIKF